jgi:hypothetical protein
MSGGRSYVAMDASQHRAFAMARVGRGYSGSRIDSAQ